MDFGFQNVGLSKTQRMQDLHIADWGPGEIAECGFKIQISKIKSLLKHRGLRLTQKIKNENVFELQSGKI